MDVITGIIFTGERESGSKALSVFLYFYIKFLGDYFLTILRSLCINTNYLSIGVGQNSSHLTQSHSKSKNISSVVAARASTVLIFAASTMLFISTTSLSSLYSPPMSNIRHLRDVI